ncbi:15249_t:CDS:2, partial [Racocetra persica]
MRQHRAGKKHSDADALSRQHDPPEVGSNRVETDVSAQKCREWLLSLAECDAEECVDETELGGYTGWSIENVELTAHNDDDEWDDKEDGDEKEENVKLEEGVESENNLPRLIAPLEKNRTESKTVLWYTQHCGYRLIAHDPRNLSVLRDWIVSGARQELARREYL